MAISSYSTVTDKFATLTKMQDENLNEKNRTQKYSGKIGLSVDDVGKYSVTHKDITNILAGDSQSFLKRSLWEFILDLFPMYHIKEAKQAIIDFVSETGDKADIFNKIKSLADQDQQWRFNATTEFIVDENKEGANKRGNSSRLTQSFHFFMFEPIFSPVNALNQPI